MKRKFFTIFIVCIGFLGIMASASTTEKQTQTPSTWFRVSFWPDVIGWPVDEDIYGLSLGLPGSYGESKTKVVGADLSIIISESPNVEGLQMSIIAIGKDSTGLQLGIANGADKFEGFQIGIFNAAVSKSESYQIGLVNKSVNSDGFQIGALNFMDDGIFPVFPLFNYSKSKK